MPENVPGIPGPGGIRDPRSTKQRADDQAKYEATEAGVPYIFENRAAWEATSKLLKEDTAAITKSQKEAAQTTVNWQKSLVMVSAVYGKVRGLLSSIVGAAKSTVMFNERLAGMQHIVLEATRKTSDAWLMIARVAAKVYSIVSILPAEVVAGAIAAASILAIFKGLSVILAGITVKMALATGGISLLLGALATGLFYLMGMRKESEAIKGTWTDITNIWKNAQAAAFAQPLPGPSFGEMWKAAPSMRFTGGGYTAGSARDTRQNPTGQTDF